jgi:hypothetical protein
VGHVEQFGLENKLSRECEALKERVDLNLVNGAPRKTEIEKYKRNKTLNSS